MTNIKWIEIDNFRGISHIRYEPKQVNLLIGRNNSGKTTILDALYYNLTGSVYNDDMGKTVYNVKVGESSGEIKSDIHKFTIYNSNTKLPENIQNSVDAVLESSLTKTCKDLNIDDNFFQELYIYLRNNALKYVYVYDDSIFIKFADDGFTGFGNRMSELQKILLNTISPNVNLYNGQTSLFDNSGIDKSLVRENPLNYSGALGNKNNGEQILRVRMKSVEFMSSLGYHIFENYYINKNGIVRVDESGKTGKFEFGDDVRIIDLENILKEYNIIPNIERLTNNGVVYKSESGGLSQIPYDRHGEGLQTLLRMLYNLTDAKDGVLLIEEPENHMHPGYLSIFVEQLMTLAEKLNIQVFMTTHSYDLIEEFGRYSHYEDEDSKRQKDLIQISRVVKRKSEHEIYNYTPEKAFEEMGKFKMDLRGT